MPPIGLHNVPVVGLVVVCYWFAYLQINGLPTNSLGAYPSFFCVGVVLKTFDLRTQGGYDTCSQGTKIYQMGCRMLIMTANHRILLANAELSLNIHNP